MEDLQSLDSRLGAEHGANNFTLEISTVMKPQRNPRPLSAVAPLKKKRNIYLRPKRMSSHMLYKPNLLLNKF
jgi:hypothetical protein